MPERLVSAAPGAGLNGREARLYESSDTNPEVFIDGVQGLLVQGLTVKVNCFRRAVDQSLESTSEFERRDVACRLVMGMDTFLALTDFLNKNAQLVAQEVKAHGGVLLDVEKMT